MREREGEGERRRKRDRERQRQNTNLGVTLELLWWCRHTRRQWNVDGSFVLCPRVSDIRRGSVLHGGEGNQHICHQAVKGCWTEEHQNTEELSDFNLCSPKSRAEILRDKRLSSLPYSFCLSENRMEILLCILLSSQRRLQRNLPAAYFFPHFPCIWKPRAAFLLSRHFSEMYCSLLRRKSRLNSKALMIWIIFPWCLFPCGKHWVC